MSILTSIENFFKGTGTDVEKFFNAFVKLFRKVPTVLQSVENFLGEVAPVVTAAVALANPVAEPAVATALATVETGLAGIQAAASAAVSGTSLLTNLQNFAADVPALLSSVKVTNPALTDTIERIVALVVGETKVLVPAVEAWVKQLATPNTTAPTTPTNVPAA
jgi:hypothetical protein